MSNLISASLVSGFLLTVPSQTLPPTQLPSESLVAQAKSEIATVSPPHSVLNYVPFFSPTAPAELDDGHGHSEETLPTVGVPGFQPGTPESVVLQTFGSPTKAVSGYWPNTRAVMYELIPEEVSLGFLFDRNSGRLRQTEVAFAQSTQLDAMLTTLSGMLGGRETEAMKQGLHKVYQRLSKDYTFNKDALKGIISRDQRDRIYIGIWDADLH